MRGSDHIEGYFYTGYLVTESTANIPEGMEFSKIFEIKSLLVNTSNIFMVNYLNILQTAVLLEQDALPPV